MAHSEIDVLYLGGIGRSGSTMLSSMLNQLPGFYAVGEMRSLWTAARDNERCGCGTPFNDCPFWTQVGLSAVGGWSRIKTLEMLELDARFVRHRHLPTTALAVATRHDRELTNYAALLMHIYEAVGEATGCEVIVDSSKDTPYAYVLSKASSANIAFVHLVRDPRGVAHSWAKVKTSPEYAHIPALADKSMAQYGGVHVAGQWLGINVLCEVLSRAVFPRSILIRYEDLVTHPDKHFARVLALVGRDPSVGFDTERTFAVQPIHTLGGNPLRFDWGSHTIEMDDEWRTSMPHRSQLAILAATLPLALKYGYIC